MSPARTLRPLLALLLGLPQLAAAQRLPDGAENAVRERPFDITAYSAELAIDPAAGRVAGSATVTLRPLRPLRSLCLDAIGLEVEEVGLVGGGSIAFENGGRELCADLGAEHGAGEELAVVVRYHAAPRAGMYFQPDVGNPGRFFVTTYGEGGLHANWLPIFTGNNDRFATEMIVSVPEPYTAVANGALVAEESIGGTNRFHWRQERPHPHYLIAVYVGVLERGELAPAFGEIPLAYWVPRGRLAEGAFAFRNTTRMVEHFSELLGYRYPWVVYDQLAIPDYAIGAMEHTGITGHNVSVLRAPGDGAPVSFGNPSFDDYHPDWTADATISHELAHHWFGDNTTCAYLGEIWLNESFASYLMMLWAEEDLGRDQLDFDVDHARRQYFGYVEEEHRIRPLRYRRFDSPNDIYNEEHTYLKGAAVLHMLRLSLGDAEFFGALSEFQHANELSPVESPDLRTSLQRVTGRNVDWFFDDWIDGGGHPRFEVESTYHENRRLLELGVRQVQPLVNGQDLFRLPVTVTIATASRRWDVDLWVAEEEELFFLPTEERPLLVSFDGRGALVAEIDFDKTLEELAYQLWNDALPGRLRALRQLVARFPHRSEAPMELARLIGDPEVFWGLRAEAAALAASLRGGAGEQIAVAALADPEQRVRKAAVLALGGMGTASSQERLRQVLAEDPAGDVAGAALVALARAGAELGVDEIGAVMARPSWYEELAVAGLVAIDELGRPDLLPLVRGYAAPPHNQDVRAAALGAWAAIAPGDPRLAEIVSGLLSSPSYVLQQLALELAGELLLDGTRPALEELARADVDANLTQLAKQSLERLDRLPTAAGGGAR